MTFRLGRAEAPQKYKILPTLNLSKTPNTSEINFQILIINFNIYGMGPKDPISVPTFLESFRRVAGLSPAHLKELVKIEGMMMVLFGQGGR